MSEGAKGRRELWEWVKALVIALIFAVLIRTFLFAPFIVDGQSMVPTLHNHERLIVSKYPTYLGTLKRGDVVVFKATQTDDYIKRIIGLPGETVEARDGVVYVNNKPLDEPYIKARADEWEAENHAPYTSEFGPVVVPEGDYFVMGDNRPNSKDSRMIGPISKKVLVGRADLVFWPLDRFKWLNGAGD